MANGMYTSSELIDSLIVDLNDAPKALVSGQYIRFCGIIDQMGQKLINLRNGVKSDLDNKTKIIEDLKQQLRNTGVEIHDMSPEEFVEEVKKGGVLSGTD